MNDSPRFDAAGADAADSSDVGALVRDARSVVGPRLRVRTVHVRARLLKDLAAHLVLKERSFDVDRGIEALAAFATTARRDLPDARHLLVGARETIDRPDAGVERTMRVPLQGVAVHANASRFPCGELLIKFAPAFLAGVPVIVRPLAASMPAVTRLVARIAASQILPEGSLQIATAEVDEIARHLGPQDVVAVSGGREAVARVRAIPAIGRSGARVRGDRGLTDVAILGADAVDGTPEFDLFVRDLAADLLNADRLTLAPRLTRDAIAHAIARTMQAQGAHGPLPVVRPYDAIAEALDAAARSTSGATATIYTNDAEIANALINGLAPIHDRVMAIDRTCSADATSDRAAQHADVRRIYDYMHVTALRGSAERVAEYTGVWGPGAVEIDDPRHPFRLSFEELAIGHTLRTASRTISLEEVERFATFTGDTFYAYASDEAVADNPFFPGRSVHANLALALAGGLIADPDPSPGPLLAHVGIDNLRFTKPLPPGDAFSARMTVAAKTPLGPRYGEVRWDVELTDQHGEPFATYDIVTINATGDTL